MAYSKYAHAGINTDIQSLQGLSLPIEGVIASVNSINLANTGTTALYIVPANIEIITSKILIIPETVTGFVTPATSNVGVNAGVGDIIAGDAVADLNAAGLVSILEPIAAAKIAVATDTINFNVTVAATATVFVATVVLVGLLIRN